MEALVVEVVTHRRRHWSFFFIDLRRRYISDLAFAGLGIIVIAVGNSAELPALAVAMLSLGGLTMLTVAGRRKFQGRSDKPRFL